jgi:hypothetical protein
MKMTSRLLLIALIPFFTTCKKEQITVSLENGYYFKGNVFGQDKYFRDSISNYKADFTESFNASSRLGTMLFGMTLTNPQVGNQQVYLGAGIINVSDYNGINNFFSLGKKPFYGYNQKDGFFVTYSIVRSLDSVYCTSCPAPINQVLTSRGNQDTSSIEIIYKQALPPPINNSYQRLKIAARINCKLYDQNNLYVGVIKDGILVGEIHIIP